jgi:hypothetical protein
MNATAFGTAARAAALAIVLALAAASGIIVGNALNARGNSDAGPNISAFVPGNPGGTVISRTAATSFSLDAIEAVQAARGDAAAAADDDYVDYGLRHAPAESEADAVQDTLAKPTPR